MKRNIDEKLDLWKAKKNRNPLIIMGARQTGKTFSLKNFGNRCFPVYHYVNFEEDEHLNKIFEQNLNPKRILNELNFYLNTSIDIKNDLLILDEIQYCPRAITSLKYFKEDMPELAVCCAGSLLGLYFGKSSFPVGKVDFLKLYPMSFVEFLSGIEEKKLFDFLKNIKLDTKIPEIIHSKLWELLKIYFVTGGLPDVVNVYRDYKRNLFEALEKVREKQNNIVLTYQADIAKHSGKENSMFINRLWKNIPSQLAREQNGSAEKYKFKDVIPGIKGYARLAGIIDWLETAGLIIKTPVINKGILPFTAFSKENWFKLYVFDVGILGAISKLPPKAILDYDYGTYKGYYAENYAAQEFTCRGEENVFCWREGTAEVEFLIEYNGKVIPIEIKSGWVTQAKSIRVFAQKYNPDYRVIMSARNIHIDSENKFHRYPLYLAAIFPLEA
jgi:predicted AAA+ superfamily ATPase